MEYNYSDLGLKTNTESIVFKFGDKEIEIFKIQNIIIHIK